MKKWIPASQRQAREIRFLAAFYESDSPTYQDGKASAIAAGYNEKIASRQGENLLKKYRDYDFKASAKAVGIDDILLGLRMKKILLEGSDRDAQSVARLVMANRGEVTDAASTKINISANQTTFKMIVGIEQHKLDRFTDGYYQAPQLEAENPDSGKTAPIVSEGEVIDVQPEPAPTEDARRLSAADFNGTNVTAAKRPRGYGCLSR